MTARLILSLCALVLGAVLFATEADAAKRLGSGRPIGTQRNVTAPPQNAAPAGQQAAPAGQQAVQAGQKGAPAAPAPAGNRWAGILGGLALGGLLGYFFGGSGLMGVLLLVGLGLLAFVVIRALMQGRAAQPAMTAGPRAFQVPLPDSMPASAAAMPAAARFPAGFDADGFLRSAKVNFVKLQLANDRGDLDEIREFTTPELFEALQAEVRARAGRQESDISALDARLLDVATEDGRHWVSVGFSGLEREAPGTEPAAFNEVWNLVKPVDGASGWLLAGIQQMH